MVEKNTLRNLGLSRKAKGGDAGVAERLAAERLGSSPSFSLTTLRLRKSHLTFVNFSCL